ncbi:S-adenosyl-L-methionine-dependent methyltransferase [Macroventuria anomochaeta]|uniref:S-adenosyl-L-methionine-dependent methyltransferase n=1 Tax=Macroventuria anomochaeta TaxID=301207 RepID=A0ACB6SEI9_9PLEO|nr:S-adenosyl-L-methionine-dependent methyltransferase [Macroventuria anomochaeta]KAF2632418.1 S-adenosyl-L-methionine-dependent methyltransferase [Macroventuria anomochaeta]
MGIGAPASSANVGETVSLLSEAAPVAAVDGDASTSPASAAPASNKQSSAETAPVPTTAAGPSTAVEYDPAPIQPPIQPESDFDESDSAYGEPDHLSDTTSIPSTIWRHRYENGRRYHKFREGEYWGPNDEVQNDQLDIAHHMFLILLDNKLHLAPIENPQRILDLGCGTGIWCIDMADEHPGAETIGVDLSPIQPSFTPPNCKFEIDDVTSSWTFPYAFDLINIRALYGSIADWPALYQQVFDNLQPGGYLHEVEMSIQFKSDDGTLTPDHILSQWSDVFHEASNRFGKSFYEVWNLSTYAKNVGFVDVVENVYKVPVNGWPADPRMKEIGRWNFLHCTQGAEGWGLFLLTKVMGWSVEEAQVFIAKFRNGLKERKVHAYFEVVQFSARKPMY